MGPYYMVEQSEVWSGSNLLLFYDPGWSGGLNSLLWNASTQQWTNQTTLFTSGRRFPYVMSFGSQIMAFSTVPNPSEGIPGDIYLHVSTDGGATFAMANGGNPVLTHSADPNSIYHNLDNIAVAAQPDGTMFMLVDSFSDPQTGNNTGLAYSYGTYNPTTKTLSFDANKSVTQVLPLAGCAYLWTDGGGNLVAIHGQLISGSWLVTASTRKGGVWQTRRDLLQIAQQGIHVADPSAFSYASDGSNTAIAFSYNQFGTRVAKAAIPFSTFMQELLQ
jgi:hypothetical protein